MSNYADPSAVKAAIDAGTPFADVRCSLLSGVWSIDPAGVPIFNRAHYLQIKGGTIVVGGDYAGCIDTPNAGRQQLQLVNDPDRGDCAKLVDP